VGNLSIEKLRYALEAAHGASGPPCHTFYGLPTPRRRRQDRTAAPILIRSAVPASAGMITFRYIDSSNRVVWL
jgi:hypothetical protein